MTQESDKVTSLLNQSKYLFLRHIGEPEENSLRLIVEEAMVDRSGTPSIEDPSGSFGKIREDAWPITSTYKCKAFELLWSHYVAYLVTEESVGSGGSDEDEVYMGNLLRVYTKSHFLSYLSSDTGGHVEELLHYKLICQNHLVDVASYRPPDIRLFSEVAGPAATDVRPF